MFGYRYPMKHSSSCLGYIVPLWGAKRNRYLVFHKSHRHLSALNNNKHTDLASWKSDKSTYFVNSLFFFSFISSLERFSQFSYLVKTTVIAVLPQANHWYNTEWMNDVVTQQWIIWQNFFNIFLINAMSLQKWKSNLSMAIQLNLVRSFFPTTKDKRQNEFAMRRPRAMKV